MDEDCEISKINSNDAAENVSNLDETQMTIEKYAEDFTTRLHHRAAALCVIETIISLKLRLTTLNSL